MVEFYTLVLILGTIVAVIGGAIGLKVASRMGKSMENGIFNDRLGLLQDENKELKKYLKSNKGALSQLKQGLTIPEGESIDGDVGGVITGLIGKYQHLCPPQLRPLLNDPAIVSFLLEQAKEHPEQTKQVLKHFISKSGDAGKEPGSEESESDYQQISAEYGA